MKRSCSMACPHNSSTGKAETGRSLGAWWPGSLVETGKTWFHERSCIKELGKECLKKIPNVHPWLPYVLVSVHTSMQTNIHTKKREKWGWSIIVWGAARNENFLGFIIKWLKIQMEKLEPKLEINSGLLLRKQPSRKIRPMGYSITNFYSLILVFVFIKISNIWEKYFKKRKDLFGLFIKKGSVHGQLALLFLVHGETEDHGRRAWKSRDTHLLAARNQENVGTDQIML